MKVMLGLSGGVDSAVAAYLLKKEGYDVIACFMRNWDAFGEGDILGNPTIDDPICPQEQDYKDAQDVADRLGITLLRKDFIKEYWDYVFKYFLSEYEKGRTPNPDVYCNKYVKFDAFRKFAKENGCDYIAMGHYAKRVDINGTAFLAKAKDQNKDQTYFLCQIDNDQLSHAIFPLGDIDKSEVRRIAEELNLVSVKDKKDSTGVCFIGERNFKEFLKNYIPAKKGNIVEIETKQVLGTHDGVMYYTIGQRKGLGIGGVKGVTNNGWFVVSKDVKNNILYVSSGDSDAHLYSSKSIITNCNFLGRKPLEGEIIGVKFRYRQKDNPCKVHYLDENTIELTHLNLYKAVTPGQIACFYADELCLGGGTIDRVFNNDKELVYFI